MKKQISSYYQFTSVLTILIIFGMVFIGNYTSAQVFPGMVEIRLSPLNPQSKTAEVSGEYGDTLSYRATLTVFQHGHDHFNDTIYVNVSGNSTAGYPVSIEPNTFIVNYVEPILETQLNISIIVPNRALTGYEHILIWAHATWENGSDFRKSGATVFVAQYFQSNISAKPMRGDNNPQKFNLTIKNLGNGKDSFHILLQNETRKKANPLKIEFNNTTTRELKTEEETSILMNLSYGFFDTPGKKVISLTLVSLGAEKNNQNMTTNISIEMVILSIWEDPHRTQIVVAPLIILIIVIIVSVFLIRKRRMKRRKVRKSLKKKSTKKIDEEE